MTAIESRDPTTSGHSRRVATLSVALAEKVDGDLRRAVRRRAASRATQLKQIEYAGVLHDFGKVGVREKVLVKAKKLYEEDRRADRAALRLHQARRSRPSTPSASCAWRWSWRRDELPARFAEIDAELGRRMDELDEAWAFVNRANEPTVLDQGGFERLVEIARLRLPGARRRAAALPRARRGGGAAGPPRQPHRRRARRDREPRRAHLQLPAQDPVGAALRRRPAHRRLRTTST